MLWSVSVFFLWDVLQSSAPTPKRNWGVRRTPRGVSGAWPGRSPGRGFCLAYHLSFPTFWQGKVKIHMGHSKGLDTHTCLFKPVAHTSLQEASIGRTRTTNALSRCHVVSPNPAQPNRTQPHPTLTKEYHLTAWRIFSTRFFFLTD